ncbi:MULTISPECIES: hypothetical protein [Citrobacter]|nr:MULTISPECIES: hypothetical protein [Citrobacter]EGT0633730.1 hypothetical protein [Citrobacter freundii]MDT7421729.1 hypothetical protein [Citrobacter freundii]MEB7949065.1 hypothetical protein [Citrobacter freundii]WFY94426.1 hypothetical protein NFK47_10310 [Citrobacter freundii]
MQNEKDKTVTLTEAERKFIMIAMIAYALSGEPSEEDAKNAEKIINKL